MSGKILHTLRRSSAASSSSGSSINSEQRDLGPEDSTIFTEPAPGCGPKKKLVHTHEHDHKMAVLKEYAYSLLLPKSDPYHPWEKRFLEDPGTMSRYCRAAKWRLHEAKDRIKGTLEWRREYKPELIKESDVRVEAETGKIILNGFDVDGRPVIYMRPGRENTQPSPRQIQHLIFVLERAIDFMPPGVETLVIIVDYASATSQTNPSVGTARKVLGILQSHYVERMGRAIVVRMPWWVNAFFTAITPFLDPVTKDKMRFNPKLQRLIPASQLDAEFGGEHNFKFDHKVYWKTLVEFCHLSPTGGRLDKNGNECVPPAGYGAHAAFEGIDKIVKTLGEPQEAVVADETPAPSDERSAATDADAAAVPAPTPPSDKNVTNVDQSVAKETTNNGDSSRGTELTDQMQGLKVDDNRSTTPGGSVDVPIAKTAPGPPASGPVVFDHPPNEDEKRQAEELLARTGMA